MLLKLSIRIWCTLVAFRSVALLVHIVEWRSSPPLLLLLFPPRPELALPLPEDFLSSISSLYRFMAAAIAILDVSLLSRLGAVQMPVLVCLLSRRMRMMFMRRIRRSLGYFVTTTSIWGKWIDLMLLWRRTPLGGPAIGTGCLCSIGI